MKLKFYTLAVMLFTVLVSAELEAGGWNGAANVKKIYPHSINNTDGTVYYAFDVMKNPDTCEKSSLMALKKSNNLSSEIYSLILTAFTTKTKVNIYVGGCDAGGYPVLLHAYIDG